VSAVERTFDFIVIDTPGADSYLMRLAHSMADTVTEVFLFVALRRGSKQADEEHPIESNLEAGRSQRPLFLYPARRRSGSLRHLHA